jgi:preprotein translocase subunit SecB
VGKSFSTNNIGAIMTESNQVEKTVAIQTIYIKDVSFEAPNSPGVFMEESIQPETKINLANTHNKIGDNSYDVSLTIKAEAIIW